MVSVDLIRWFNRKSTDQDLLCFQKEGLEKNVHTCSVLTRLNTVKGPGTYCICAKNPVHADVSKAECCPHGGATYCVFVVNFFSFDFFCI